VIANAELLIFGFDDFADAAALHWLAQFEWGNVAFALVHPPAHVRIDGEPEIADEDFPAAR
jgi:hypothetical protein